MLSGCCLSGLASATPAEGCGAASFLGFSRCWVQRQPPCPSEGYMSAAAEAASGGCHSAHEAGGEAATAAWMVPLVALSS